MKPLSILLLATLAVSVSGLGTVAFAEEASPAGGLSDGSKLIGAGLAFGLAAMGAGIGLGYVGSAGLAVITENPALQLNTMNFSVSGSGSIMPTAPKVDHFPSPSQYVFDLHN